MFTLGQKVRVIADGEDFGTGVIFSLDKRVAGEITVLLDCSTEEDTHYYDVFAGQEDFLTAV